jgi:chromosome partitioning protein
MQTIVINNQKGGVGKTLLSVHIAWFLAEQGGTVLFIDLDGQGNSTTVLKDEHRGGYAADLFEASKLEPLNAGPGITVLASDKRLDAIEREGAEAMIPQFAKIAEAFDYCVVDTPPAWGWRNFAAMAVCDHLLAPVELKDFAISGVGQLLQSMKQVQQMGRNGRAINFLGLLASRFNSHSRRERDNLQTLLNEFGDKMMFPGVITTRDGYEQAMSDAVPVWKIKTSGATVAGSEIRKILATVRDRITQPATPEAVTEAV